MVTNNYVSGRFPPVRKRSNSYVPGMKTVLSLTFLILLFSFTGLPSAQAQNYSGKIYQHWADADLKWQGDILSAQKSDYFEGEVIPHLAVLQGNNQNPLVNGQSYQFTVVYNFYQSNTNAGGFAFITTYNANRQPAIFSEGLNLAPTLDNTFTNNGGFVAGGSPSGFFTNRADITAVSAPVKSGSGTFDNTVTITFTYTGPTGSFAEIYYGLYISKPGIVPDQGKGSTSGAHLWTGGSLQTTLSSSFGGASSIQLSPNAIIVGTISGKKFKDADKSSSFTAGDTYLPGWEIQLYSDAGFTNLLQTTTTDQNGAYAFSVGTGTYYVKEVLQANWTQTYPTTNNGTYGPISITAATPTSTGNDFGNFTCPTVTLTATPSPVSCFGGSDGSISGTVSGGAVPNTVTLKQNGSTVATTTVSTEGGSYNFTSLAAGSYTVEAVDKNSCPATSQPATVGGPTAAVDVTATGAPVSCFGGSDGSISGTVSGGTPPYTVTLLKGGVSQGSQTVNNSGDAYSFTSLAAGTDYTVTATDSKGTTGGCADQAPATVGGPAAAVDVTATGAPVSCFGGSDGSISGTVSGGTAPYTVTLLKGGVSQGSQTVNNSGDAYSFTSLAAGTDYTVTATDSKGTTGGCADQAPATVGGPAAAVDVTATPTDETCIGKDGQINGTVSGGTAPYTVTLKQGSTTVGSTTVSADGGSYSFTGLAAGSYTVEATDAKGTTGGCFDSETATIGSPTNCAHIFPTQTTCCNYLNGPTGSFQLSQICMTLSGSTVTNAIPGVFFYYGDYTHTGTSGSVTIYVKQMSSAQPFAPQNLNQLRVFVDQCQTVTPTATQINGGDAVITFDAIQGKKYVISVKYDTKSIIGYAVPDNTVYTFGLSLDNSTILSNTQGQLTAKVGCSDNTGTPSGDCAAPVTVSTRSSVREASTPRLQVLTSPNPYNDKVRFVIRSSESGPVTLDLFNLLGQKVQTVYKGNIQAGVSQTFDFTVPETHRTTLFYIFRQGGESTTGKLLQGKR